MLGIFNSDNPTRHMSKRKQDIEIIIRSPQTGSGRTNLSIELARKMQEANND